MDKDNDWVEDVKRWCRAGGASSAQRKTGTPQIDEDGAAFGYEAANPALQARHWPDASSSFPSLPLNR